VRSSKSVPETATERSEVYGQMIGNAPQPVSRGSIKIIGRRRIVIRLTLDYWERITAERGTPGKLGIESRF
jgi:hypothetical protein